MPRLNTLGTKLYVLNLPLEPSAVALRAHFGACGEVSDVEIVPDRNGGRGTGTAFVQMASARAAERAVNTLNGTLFAGQLLVVKPAPDVASDRRGGKGRDSDKNDEERVPARIAFQFREAANMAYELDCAGVAVLIRVSYPSSTGESRISAQATLTADAPSVDATAASRIEAFRSVARASRERQDLGALRDVDWTAVEEAMLKVRAL